MTELTDSSDQDTAGDSGDSPVEYPDSAGYPDGEGIVGNGPTTDAPPSGVDATLADEPETEETLDGDVPTDEEDTEVNDG